MVIRSAPSAIRVSGDPYFAYTPYGKKAEEVKRMLSQFETLQTVNLDGTILTVAQVAAIARRPTVAVALDHAVGKERVTQSAERMAETIAPAAAECGITLSLTATLEKLCSLKNAGVIGKETLPSSSSKAAMLVLTNSLMLDNLGIRLEILQAITRLMNQNLIPKLPLGGTTTTSGDFVPLSYIAGAIAGFDNSMVETPEGGEISAAEALKLAAIVNGPFELQANEVVALVNGTAAGLAVAAIVCFDANVLAVLAEILSAMFCEVRHGSPKVEWLGTQLGEIQNVTHLIETEINSVNDGSVIDGIIIVNAMNKFLIAIADIGKRMSDQFSELVCYKSLPSNITMAEYCSKLQHLAYPGTTHVGGLEMGLRSAQKSQQAVRILKLMSATYMVVLCQAIDLNHMEENMRDEVKHIVLKTVGMTLNTAEDDGSLLEALEKELAQLSFSEMPIYASHTLVSRLTNFLNEKALAGNNDVGFLIFKRIEVFSEELEKRLWAEMPEAMKKFKGGDFVVGKRIEKCSTYPVYQFVRMVMPRGGNTMCPGEWIEKVYEAIGEGKLEEVVMKCLASFTPIPRGWFEWARSLVAVVAETGRFWNF